MSIASEGMARWLVDHMGASKEVADETIRLLLSDNPKDIEEMDQGMRDMLNRLAKDA